MNKGNNAKLDRDNKPKCLKVFNTNVFLDKYKKYSKFLLDEVSRGKKFLQKFLKIRH